jgi:hypothetical protein
MKLSTILSGLAALALSSVATAAERKAAIYIQPISTTPSTPALLAEISYDPALASEASIASFEFPELADDVENVRIGVYSPWSKTWESSTSVASVANFGKGYSPHLILSVGAQGDVVGAACRGVRIDAGQTRDFGPKAVVRVTEPGAQVELNKPVVLSPEGKKAGEPEEKTMLQKYGPPMFVLGWGSCANPSQVLVGYWHRGPAYHDWWWWRQQIIDDQSNVNGSLVSNFHLIPCAAFRL